MNTLKALFLLTLMSASVAAMAEGGGDTVMARMEAARASAVAHQQLAQQVTAVASNQKAAASDSARSN